MSEYRPDDKGIIIEHKDKVNIMVDMSQFDLFELCPCRYDYRYNHNKALPVERQNDALDKGSLMHEGMEVYFKLLMQEIKYQDRIHAAVMKIRQMSSDPDNSNVDPDDVNKLIKAIEQSCDYWRFEDEQLIIHYVEQAFAYVLYEDDDVRIIITGKIDLLVDIPPFAGRPGYKRIPFDHKTYSRDGEVLRLANQFENYCVAVNSHYLIVNRIGLQTSLAPDEKFKRLPLSYDEDILQQWKDNTTTVILQRYLPCVANQKWPMNYTSCLKFNKRCEYYEICDTSGQEAKMWKLNSEYRTVSPWDVTAKFKKG